MVSGAAAVVVIGDGIVGLSVALHLALRGIRVNVLSSFLPGAASPASGGMLAPSVERTQGPAQAFGEAARDAWDRLAAATAARNARFMLRRNGIMRIATTPEEEERLRRTVQSGDSWLTPDDVRTREPSVVEVRGAALYAGDGVVDAPACLSAIRSVLESDARVAFLTARAAEIRTSGADLEVLAREGTRHRAPIVVVAAGAWSTQVGGLPVKVPMQPVRGTLLAVGGPPVNDPIYAGSGHWYAFPRGAHTLVGATSDEVGFESSAGADDMQRLLDGAAGLLSDARKRPRLGTLTGLRPITTDNLACIGPSKAQRGLIYACGHGRNGFLQGPLTGEVVAALVEGADPGVDISAFDPDRFSM